MERISKLKYGKVLLQRNHDVWSEQGSIVDRYDIAHFNTGEKNLRGIRRIQNTELGKHPGIYSVNMGLALENTDISYLCI